MVQLLSLFAWLFIHDNWLEVETDSIFLPSLVVAAHFFFGLKGCRGIFILQEGLSIGLIIFRGQTLFFLIFITLCHRLTIVFLNCLFLYRISSASTCPTLLLSSTSYQTAPPLPPPNQIPINFHLPQYLLPPQLILKLQLIHSFSLHN